MLKPRTRASAIGIQRFPTRKQFGRFWKHSVMRRVNTWSSVLCPATAARPGGAYLAEVIETASGCNPQIERARIEVALSRGEPYVLPESRDVYAGSVICLARQESANMGAYDAPKMCTGSRSTIMRGSLCRQSPSVEKVSELLDDYSRRFAQTFMLAWMRRQNRPFEVS